MHCVNGASRVASLLASATEILYALGLGDRGGPQQCGIRLGGGRLRRHVFSLSELVGTIAARRMWYLPDRFGSTEHPIGRIRQVCATRKSNLSDTASDLPNSYAELNRAFPPHE